MIPKTIHYFWFGRNKKDALILRCLASWKETCPDFVIKEWNEDNFDIMMHPFTARMYATEKWAFVADYARLAILEKEGGIYLDTDMELVKNISPLLDKELVLGEEEPGIISAGMIASAPHHPYIEACRKVYDAITGLPPTIPHLMTSVYNDMRPALNDIKVCPPITFYPFSQENIKTYSKEKLTSDTYGVHLWNYSWGHPILRFLNKFTLYHMTKKVLDSLGIKYVLKKILGLS